MSKNLCNKTVKAEEAYEVWANDDQSWIHWVLKKYQSPEAEAKNPYARWLCAVSSPMTYGSREIGDVYATDVKRTMHQILNPLIPVKEAMKAYEAEPDAFWKALPMMGGDGYDAMEYAEERGWKAASSWGSRGWDLGSWPLVICFFRKKDGMFQLAVYCEGDVEMYSCPNKWIREQITDAIAFFYWKNHDDEWVKDYETIDQVPFDSDLRGPYRS